jgi:hypothetical protein
VKYANIGIYGCSFLDYTNKIMLDNHTRSSENIRFISTLEKELFKIKI